MDSHPATPPAGPEGRGLPPVTPPSGRFIAQLFLVPGMIVLVAVLLLLAFRYLLGGGYSPENFLRQLDNDNADIRWRGANDLAQVLKRPESMNLKADVGFALDLIQRLRRGLDDLLQDEKQVHDRTAKATQAEKDAAWLKLEAKRNHVNFLAAALGDFVVPVGVPILCEMSVCDDSPDPKGVLRRRMALSSLISLGNNVTGFKKLPAAQQSEVLVSLQRETESTNPLRAVAAATALFYLDKSRLAADGGQGVVEVDRKLALIARDQDQFLRELVTFAFNFWDGPLAEPTLQKLARDKGHGTLAGISE